MGTLITGSIKSLLTIKAKTRHDTYTDQFHRIFMVKMCMVASLLLGLNWLKDTITCIIPNTAGISSNYVHQACWIQGFYVYKELKHVPGLFGYYGIPKDLDDNGLLSNGRLCQASDKSSDCQPMTKTFYLQYQWFPFYVATIALLYYLPYLFFRYVNTDLISLKDNIKGVEQVDIDGVVQNYFNHEINPVGKMRMRLVANVFVKLFYIIVNVIAFTGTDSLINGDFKAYGREWLNWGKHENSIEFDYTATRHKFKPAEKLLPTFGICEVLELGKDIKHSLFNTHRFVCEISQNVLYHYVLVLLWFLFIMGMIVSCLGLLILIGDHMLTVTSFVSQGDKSRAMYKKLSLRECQYLEYIRKKDLAVFGKVIRKLKDERFHTLDGPNGFIPPSHNNPYKDSQKLLQETLHMST